MELAVAVRELLVSDRITRQTPAGRAASSYRAFSIRRACRSSMVDGVWLLRDTRKSSVARLNGPTLSLHERRRTASSRVGGTGSCGKRGVVKGRRTAREKRPRRLPSLYHSPSALSVLRTPTMITRILPYLRRTSLLARAVPRPALLLPHTPLLLRLASAPSKRPLLRSTQLTDEAIPHPLITLVDPTTSTLTPPTSLSDLLIALDRTRFSILLVDPSHDPPICKILDKKVQYAKAQSKKAKDAAPPAAGTPVKSVAGPPKEVHLTWGVTAHDLSHKLAKAKELLEKGHRVVVVVTNKKGSEGVDGKRKDEVIHGIQAALEGIGKLRKDPENKGGQVLLEFNRV